MSTPDPIAFDTTQITSPDNRCNPQPGDPCHPLAAQGHPPTIAFSCKDHGADAGEEISPTLRAMGHKDSHMNGGGQVAVCFKPSHFTRDKDGAPSDLVPPLSADADKGDQEPVVFQTRIARNGRGQPESVVPALNGTNAGDTSDMRPVVAGAAYGVRRLTPTECERLQAWPDGWTAKRAKLKREGNLWKSTGGVEQQTDSPRYKQAGNGVTSAVPEWIGNRINQFHA